MSRAVLRAGGQVFPSQPWFYTGTHMPNWLWDGQMTVPLFVSRAITMYGQGALRPAVVPWALDSGGFTELSKYGRWTLDPLAYVLMVADLDRTIGNLDWAAPQDMMCEKEIIHGGRLPNGVIAPGTGLSAAVHQRLTVENGILLRELWPQHSDSECPFIYVVQGDPDDPESHWRCADLYKAYGVDLEAEPLVGLGSVCRQQATARIGYLIEQLSTRYRLHGFGCKTQGLVAYGHHLASADSLAWSYNAYRHAPLPGHTHQTCSNCPEYAARWTEHLADAIDARAQAGWQESLFGGEAA